MRLAAGRFLLRDFVEADRNTFAAYQSDARYRALHDIGEDESNVAANRLFDLFLDWASQTPRRNFQLGIFDVAGGTLCGCIGLRTADAPPRTAIFGLELAPDHWGRYRLAIDAAAALIAFGCSELDLDCIAGSTASGNRRIERLARWFGAEVGASRPGHPWMARRGWQEVDWSLSRAAWFSRARRTALWSPSRS